MLPDLDQLAALALGLLLGRLARDLIFGLGFLGLDYADTHLAELRQDVICPDLTSSEDSNALIWS